MEPTIQETAAVEPEAAAERAEPSQEEILRRIMRETVAEALQARVEPAAAELDGERRKREELERKLNELVEENRHARAKADEAERQNAIRGELQRLGVAKVDLAFRAVKDDILRGEDGRFLAKTAAGEAPLAEYLKRFLEDNPELLPARMSGGSGASPAHGGHAPGSRVDLDRIKPGMSAEELDQVRQEIIRVANQTFRGF